MRVTCPRVACGCTDSTSISSCLQRELSGKSPSICTSQALKANADLEHRTHLPRQHVWPLSCSPSPRARQSPSSTILPFENDCRCGQPSKLPNPGSCVGGKQIICRSGNIPRIRTHKDKGEFSVYLLIVSIYPHILFEFGHHKMTCATVTAAFRSAG